MTVKELMELLSKFDGNTPVEIFFDGGYGGGDLTKDCVYLSSNGDAVCFDADEAR